MMSKALSLILTASTLLAQKKLGIQKAEKGKPTTQLIY